MHVQNDQELTALHVGEEVCSPVAHRQVVLTIPKRLRVHTRFDRQLLGKLSSSAWTCLKAEAVRLLGREDVVPGMIAATGDAWRTPALASSHPCADHLRRIYTRRRFSGVARVR